MSVFHVKPEVAEAVRELSLEWLHARVVDKDGCLVWTLAAAHGSDPQARIGGREHGITMLVRRALWELVHEQHFPRNRVARCTCETPLCVHPEHIAAIPKTQLRRGVAIPLHVRAKIAATKRAESRLSDANVAFIRSTDGPLVLAAEQFGIDPTYVSMIRLGKVRRDYASPFNGLGARRG